MEYGKFKVVINLGIVKSIFENFLCFLWFYKYKLK